MPQMLRQDNIPRMLVASTTTATLAITSGGNTTSVTIGGQSYQPASLLTLNAATVGANGLDAGSLGASQLWYVYAIAHQTSFAMALVASLSAAPTMPTGYGTAYKLIGAFNTNASSQISFTVVPEDGVVYPVVGANITAPISSTLLSYSSNPMIAGTHISGGNQTAPVLLGWANITVQQGGITYNSGTKRFTVPIAGFYQIQFACTKLPSQGGRINIGINTDAPTNVTAKATSYADTASGTIPITVSQIVSLAANDYIVCFLDIGQVYGNVSDNAYQYFSIIKVG